jgi:four helix bundle protein
MEAQPIKHSSFIIHHPPFNIQHSTFTIQHLIMRENIIKTKSFDFALSIVGLYKQMQEKKEFVISKQLLRSATSIGANVEEADAGQTRKDFIAKMSIAAKEARETHYWLRLLQRSQLVSLDYSTYISAVEEIIRIITSIIKTAQQNINENK